MATPGQSRFRPGLLFRPARDTAAPSCDQNARDQPRTRCLPAVGRPNQHDTAIATRRRSRDSTGNRQLGRSLANSQEQANEDRRNNTSARPTTPSPIAVATKSQSSCMVEFLQSAVSRNRAQAGPNKIERKPRRAAVQEALRTFLEPVSKPQTRGVTVPILLRRLRKIGTVPAALMVIRCRASSRQIPDLGHYTIGPRSLRHPLVCGMINLSI